MSKPDNMEERLEAVRLLEATLAADIALDEAPKDMPDAEYEALATAARKAERAWGDWPVKVEQGYEGDVLRCSACDAPIVQDDELLEDTHTGEYFLRSALGLPQRAQEEEQMLPDMAEAV